MEFCLQRWVGNLSSFFKIRSVERACYARRLEAGINCCGECVLLHHVTEPGTRVAMGGNAAASGGVVGLMRRLATQAKTAITVRSEQPAYKQAAQGVGISTSPHVARPAKRASFRTA